jgi:hypothetical protein
MSARYFQFPFGRIFSRITDRALLRRRTSNVHAEGGTLIAALRAAMRWKTEHPECASPEEMARALFDTSTASDACQTSVVENSLIATRVVVLRPSFAFNPPHRHQNLEWPDTKPAVLNAFDATQLGEPIYNFEQNSQRDRAALAARFVIPIVVNGRVYFGTRSEVEVYGLLK